MSDNEIRLNIGELRGLISDTDIRQKIGELCGLTSEDVIPYYLNDLNACAQFRHHLTELEYADYSVLLGMIVERGNLGLVQRLHSVDAVARQRCKAFLTAKNLIQE